MDPSTIPSRAQSASRACAALIVLGCAAFLASTIAGLAWSGSAAGATPCAEAIVADWFHDGRIDRLYALPCYEQAIDAVPEELRDYTDAEEVISRAFQAASGRRLETRTLEGPTPGPVPPKKTPPVSTASTSAVPIPLLVLAGLAMTMLLAGGLAHVSRRRRGHDPDSHGDGDGTNPAGRH